jgi:hypothetical protein
MSIRDDEIKRLDQYARGLGLGVEFRQHRPGNPGAALVSFDGKSEKIVMYLWPRKSKLQIVLDFIHELAHHVAWIHKNRKDDPKLVDALVEEDSRKENDPPIAKRKRHLIYKCEKHDASYRDIIAHEVGLQLPKHALDIDRDLDLWLYKWYYDTGTSPSRKQFQEKKQELKRKYNANSI